MNRRRSIQNKIELLSCQNNSQKCRDTLSLINQNYALAQDYYYEKDYVNSINNLKAAYYAATQFNEKSCLNCATFFRSVLTQSLENINDELKGLSTGWFSRKKYRAIYAESCSVLSDIKKIP